jgi:hypothetical protein
MRDNYVIICLLGEDVLFLSSAYKNAWGSLEMAWMTSDYEKAQLKHELAVINNDVEGSTIKIHQL